MDERVTRFLLEQGWHPERNVPILLSTWVTEFFEPEGFELSAPARELLLALGGLAFEQEAAGETVARSGFQFDPTLCSSEADRFQRFEAVIGVQLCPVGEAHDGHTYLAVAEDGRMLCIMDDAWIIGSCIEDGLAALILGRLGEVIYAP